MERVAQWVGWSLSIGPDRGVLGWDAGCLSISWLSPVWCAYLSIPNAVSTPQNWGRKGTPNRQYSCMHSLSSIFKSHYHTWSLSHPERNEARCRRENSRRENTHKLIWLHVPLGNFHISFRECFTWKTQPPHSPTMDSDSLELYPPFLYIIVWHVLPHFIFIFHYTLIIIIVHYWWTPPKNYLH